MHGVVLFFFTWVFIVGGLSALTLDRVGTSHSLSGAQWTHPILGLAAMITGVAIWQLDPLFPTLIQLWGK